MRTTLKIRLLTSLLVLLFFCHATTVTAGDPAFRQLQRVKLPFSPSTHEYTHTDDFKFFLCSTKADMLMLDGINGKILWQKNFEKDYSNKKFSNQFWNRSANVVLVFDEDTKKGVVMKYFIDGKTGKLLWSSDKYVSELGQYELSYGFSNYYSEKYNAVLLPTKGSVDMVEVTTGKTLWSKPITLTGKAKEFDCFIMAYYNLVRVNMGKESSVYLTVDEGKEVTEIEPYFDKKRFLASGSRTRILVIPEKDMYVLMITETNKGYSAFTGYNLPELEMTFKAYNSKTDALIWSKEYFVKCEFDWVNNHDVFAKMYYDGVNLYLEHDPSPKPNTGLTVLNPDNGERIWETSFKTGERKSSGLRKVLTTPFPAPDPVTVDGKTYVVDKAKNRVSCFDTKKGTKIWESEEFPDAQKIPTLVVADGLVIMAHGAPARKCASITQDKGPNIERYEFNNKDKYGIIAYDAATGKVVWSNETIEKKAKDKFDYVAGILLIDGKLLCATDKNFFTLDPKTGDVIKSVPVASEKLGEPWSMLWFEKEGKIILNCEDGIIKINPSAMKVEGKVEVPTFPMFLPFVLMNGDDLYQDYAVFTKGDGTKMELKEFACIDLDKMAVRGLENAVIFEYKPSRFSEGGEMFYKVDGEEISIYSVK